MKISHLFAIFGIIAATAFAWFILASAVESRAHRAHQKSSYEVDAIWGPSLAQAHPSAFFLSPNVPNGKATVMPEQSRIGIQLKSDPKKRGLITYAAYVCDFAASYQFRNPTMINRTLFIVLPLPQTQSLLGVSVKLNGADTEVRRNRQGHIELAVEAAASATLQLEVSYQTNGSDTWIYQFPDPSRIRDFELVMNTNFSDYSIPNDCGSPTSRDVEKGKFTWTYFPDVLSAPNIGMEMPKILNPAPVAARIAFYAPVSLLFFVTVLLLIASLRGIHLHPMHVCFVAAGFFSFHLLFAYLTDIVPIYVAFATSTVVSVLLVCGYLRAIGGGSMLKIAFPAQLGYMVLFSFSFFFDGLTGITISIGSVITLALLMVVTAKTSWQDFFTKKKSAARRAVPADPLQE